MTGEKLLEYCLEKKGAYLCFPFGEDYTVVKLKTSEKRNGYIFAEIFVRDGEAKFTFSTTADDAIFLREAYPDAIKRGWHCPPVQAKYKSTATLRLVGEDMTKKFADASYAHAYSKLTKEERENL